MPAAPRPYQLQEKDLASHTVEFPKRFPLAISPENRDDSTAKDARLVNCYLERDKETGGYRLFGRPGLLTSVTKSGNGYGCYRWRGNTYSIFGATIYKDGVDMGATLDTTNGVYRWDESLNPTRLLLGNGVKGYTLDGTTVTQITDGDFPTSFVKGWGFLDATNYVMVGSTATIQGSDNNAPTSWDPLNAIVVQIEPDQGVALSKQLVYIVALKQWSTEIFFDAGNATGSPLGRVQGAKIDWGCKTADSVREIDGMLLWVGTNLKGNQAADRPQVILMRDVKAKAVSTPEIERLMKGADFTACFTFTINLPGHRFYVMTLKTDNLTLVYDVDEEKWHQWTDSAGNYFPFVSSTSINGSALLQHETNGKLYLCDPDYATDDGTVLQIDAYTPNFDGGIRRRKLLSKLEFISYQTAGSVLQVRHNDFDFKEDKWSNFREVDLSRSRPYLVDEGTFYRRAYNLRHRAPVKFYLEAMEMQLGLGTL